MTILKSTLVGAFAALAMLMLAPAAPAAAAIIQFTASLTGDQEVPPVATDATGEAVISVDTTAETIDFVLQVVGISLDDLFEVSEPLGPVHLHNAPPGVNGPIVIPFPFDATYTATADGFTVNVTDLSFVDAVALSGSTLTFDQFLAEMFAGNFYANVHTDENPGGEIRGQVVPLPGAIPLFLAGAAGFAALRRRRRGRL